MMFINEKNMHKLVYRMSEYMREVNKIKSKMKQIINCIKCLITISEK